MMHNLLSIALAAFGLGLLIFIHELGHYFMARRQGMTVEAFGIGFGKPVLTWDHKGVKWSLNILPFGGYVRIAGMEKKGSLEPYQIPDGFYGKKPMARIKVALMGPIVNIVFAFLAFTVIWMAGGRDKPFSEYTRLIGWVDPQSKIYEMGVRPGDEITQIDAEPYQGLNDLRYALLLKKQAPEIKGFEINYATDKKKPFCYSLAASERNNFLMNGVIIPASFLIYKNGSVEGSPIAASGIQNNDRIVWVDGERVFSQFQLMQIINESKSLLTIKRGDSTFLTRAPRLKVSDLHISPMEKEEIDDWQHECGMKCKVAQAYFIPYTVSRNCTVKETLTYIDENVEEATHFQPPRASLEIPLKVGDQIIAVDGQAVHTSVQMLSTLQKRKVHVVVQREPKLPSLSWQNEDNYFASSINGTDLQDLTSSIGTDHLLSERGSLQLLNPMTPMPVSEFPLSEENKARQAEFLSQRKAEIASIKDTKERAYQMRLLEESEKRLVLGLKLQDLEVRYNPSPFVMFKDVFAETYRTLAALVTGYLSPKWMSGPVGIVQVMHYGWSIGIKEALFWMAVISLNLGILNLLPLPVLDGGHVCFAVVESITKKPIKAKTMERLVLPFIILLIAFFIYLTYNDLSRLLHRFF